ncbi:MAG TPA: hypothetical protein PLH56_07465 [Candidatus Omnitrophota bacterium]|nr:hypothetical protein [Candidatus Omnitrophota bacterium]
MNQEFDDIVERICERDPRYKQDAYAFVMEALSFTQKKQDYPRHVSGEEILNGMKEILLDKYGLMALTVLEHWGIKNTEDFGHIVFNLVENKILTKTEDDNIDTFKDAYDFQEVFNRGYRKNLHKRISRMRSI